MKRLTIAVSVVLSLVLGASGVQAGQAWLETAQVVSFVAKIDVSDMPAAVKWYVGNLGLVPDSRFSTPDWQQLNLPNMTKNVAIGLNLNPRHKGVGTGGATATFVVTDIAAERAALLKKGISVGSVMYVGDGVCLAFFKDPDGNSLGLRQNNCTLPKADGAEEPSQQPLVHEAGGTLIQYGSYNKTGSGGYSVQFRAPYARPPVVLLTPFWKGANDEVGNVETLNTITETGFTGYSVNYGPNYFIEWVAFGTSGRQ